MHGLEVAGMLRRMEQHTTLHFVEPCSRTRAAQARLALTIGFHAEIYASVEELVERVPEDGIVLVRDDAITGGVARTVKALASKGRWLPIVGLHDAPDPRRVVDAIKLGALDYLATPLCPENLRELATRIGAEAVAHGEARRRMIAARGRLADLSRREREVLDWLMSGGSNKLIARQLDISPRTVEIHRANMMTKLGVRHAADAIRLGLEAQAVMPLPLAA